MKIDIHVHTKKIKSGDSDKRNITAERFSEIIRASDVRILAITNHNHFDLAQYEQFRDSVKGVCDLWPGIELDVVEEGRRAHLIVIANPASCKLFDKKVSGMLSGKNPDPFTVSLDDVVKVFEELDCVYIPHYYVKKPCLTDDDIERLTTLVKKPKRILKEATNSISAGIYISHGHKSIYGSDVHNWDEYLDISKTLPDLRLPVESFEQFCLLLDKDDATIDTLLNKKIKEPIQINPFGIAELLEIDIYNDINILFGSKGTGKTLILEALSRFYNAKGYKTEVYESNQGHINDIYDLKCSNYEIDVETLGFDTCEEELKFIKESSEEEVTSLSKYISHFVVDETNKIAKTITVRHLTKLDELEPKRKLRFIKDVLEKFEIFNGEVARNTQLEDILGKDLKSDFISVLEKVLNKLIDETESRFLEAKSIKLFNHLLAVLTTEIAKKTGQPEKPTTTGFVEYAANRLQIEKAVERILSNLNRKIEPALEYAGDLGPKGELYCKTNLVIQNGSFKNSEYSTLHNVTKTIQVDVAIGVQAIRKNIYTNDLFKKIAELKEKISGSTVESLLDLLLINRHFVLGDIPYKPSNGESSMILLHKELKSDKDIFLIDEPEKSLGNDYINHVIVPLLKQMALLGKRVIIATHDANIAVRTLPYNSIYRMHDIHRYYTFTGNPFSNNLKCVTKDKADLDWKEISMITLEGGKEAFGERGKIYGNT